MTLSELIEQLQQIAAEIHDPDDDPEVRVAIQPTYPFECDLAEVSVYEEALGSDGHWYPAEEYWAMVEADAGFDGGEFSGPWHDENRAEIRTVVYVAQGEQIGYLDTPAATAAWARA